MTIFIPLALRDKAKSHARAREKLHSAHPSSRPLSQNYEYIGLLGECALQIFLQQQLDWSLRPGGDKGVDFKIGPYSVDIKTARKPFNLLREANKTHGDILVLAGINPDLDHVSLIGWEFDASISQSPTKDFGYGILNHFIPAHSLRPILSLRSLSFSDVCPY